MCQGGKPDTGKFHSSYIGMYVAREWVCGRWHVCYGSGLSIIISITLSKMLLLLMICKCMHK